MAGKKHACWQCLECAYIYDPEKGDPKEGIPPRTPFEETSGFLAMPEVQGD